MGSISAGSTLLTQLQEFIPEKLLADDPLMEDNWNKIVDFATKTLETLKEIDFYLPPVGFVYTQFPGMKTPGQLWPADTTSYWKNISDLFSGNFFRAEGGRAAAFGSAQNDAFQGFAISTPGIYGNSDGVQFGWARAGGINGNLAMPITNGGSFVNNGYGEPRVDNETRPINRTIRIWQRIA